MKKVGLFFASILSLGWGLIPSRLRFGLLTGLFVLESRQGNPGNGLTRLLLLRDRLEWVINERAMAYGHGEHPKHRLMRYHDFFTDRIANGERVIDIGCGYGAVARSIARARSDSEVVGIDQDHGRLELARASENPSNLSFVEGDVTQVIPPGPWDVVVLSNVLEHIVDRVGFLQALKASTSASRYLIRVPLFERDWQMALRRELAINFFSDNDHKIEHTQAEFRADIGAAGLVTVEMLTLWGEIWADCRPQGANAI